MTRLNNWLRSPHRWLTAAWIGVGLSLGTPASAQPASSWANGRSTPRLRELIALDQTGEPGWLFGSEDVAGDGLTRFEPSEQAIDLRSAYTTTAASRLWLRAYVAAQTAPDESLHVYFFIDSDKDRTTGGSAVAPEIDAALARDDSPGGYDYVVGMQGDTLLARVWRFRAPQQDYAALALPPLDAAAETGLDLDPLRVFARPHGYLQVALDLDAVELGATCDANLLVRSTNAADLSDLDLGSVGPCVAADGDRNGVVDLIEVRTGCDTDDQCPAHGLCFAHRCVYPRYCALDADCGSDERCGTDDVCVVRGDTDCDGAGACSGGLLCSANDRCQACSSDVACGAGRRCAASGRCIDENARSGFATSTSADGVVLGAGEEVQGGACACELVRQNRAPLACWTLACLGLAFSWRRRVRARR